MEQKRDRDALYASVRPAERQIDHQKKEFYGFIHFTVNTFTDREWGDGSERESVFAPTALDAGQWARTARDGGMKGLILTCKHHDGFCLWPSALTEHSVRNSPYKGGKGDVVGEVSAACARYGLAFGVYLSPWDRNHPSYGTGKAYDDYFVGQLTELLTGYGPVFSVWFDGACGEGPNGAKQVYDWDRYWATVRRLQPGACICVCGPDVRWCGNEAGDTRPSEWSVVPERLRRAETVEAKSQKADDASFRRKRIESSDRDLGSREALAGEEELVWYPAEVNTSVRPGWFYHASEDGMVRSFEELRRIYLNAVGGNAMLLLNLPPDRRGLIHENDAAVLARLGRFIREAFRDDLARDAAFSSPDAKEGFGPENLIEEGYDAYFRAGEGANTARIDLKWAEPRTMGYVTLMENIRLGQRIERFDLVCETEDGGETTVFSGTTVGYKRIAAFEKPVTTGRLSIVIRDSRTWPTLAFVGVYGPYAG